MKGVFGRILWVDLTEQTCEIQTPLDRVYEEFIGGKGLGSQLLGQYNPAGVDPLSPDNLLIFATGPLCHGPAWGGSRYGVFTKSPLTGFYSESYSGGRVPEAIDSAGFDALVLKGASKTPVVLSIHPDGAEFFDGSSLWGKDTYETETGAIEKFSVKKPEYGKPGAIVIGPAGENLVRFALIENDRWRSAGRTGVGAVMGSKKLKAIVFQGDRKRSYHDPEGVRKYATRFMKEGRDNPGVQAYKKLGTTMMVAIMNKAGAFPAKYWTQGTCDHWPRISGDTFHEEHEVKPHACAKCFMACGRMATIKKGRHAGLVIEGPEYETIYAFGGLCMIDDLGEIAYLNDVCDRLGIDTITAGNLCALTIEAAARKIVDFPITYNDPDNTARLLEMISSKQGIGALLAEGIKNAAREWGLEDIAVHVKGLEPAGYDPRALKGMGLAYAVSDRGACHLRTTFYKPELAGLAPEDMDGKAEMLLDYEDRLTIFDTLVLCRFYRDLYVWDELRTVIGLVTGLELTEEDLRAVASRIANTIRRFNIQEGLTMEDDWLPKVLHKKLSTGQELTEQELMAMLSKYYQLRGWDESGQPL